MKALKSICRTVVSSLSPMILIATGVSVPMVELESSDLFQGVPTDYILSDSNPRLVVTENKEGETKVSVDASADVEFDNFTLDHSTVMSVEEGSVILEGLDLDLTTIVRASDSLTQVIFVVDSSAGLASTKITFSNEIESIVSVDDEHQIVTFVGSAESLVVARPWAFDAEGEYLETFFEYDGNSLVQRVIVTDETIYPVTADPAWSYAYSYSTMHRTPQYAKTALMGSGNFSRFFPLPGTPKNWPLVGQKLPFRIPFQSVGYNFECTFRGAYSGSDATSTWWGFKLAATANHVDGAGSNIQFSFTRSFTTGKNQLHVYAVIQKDKPLNLNRSVYRAGASRQWAEFANRIVLG